MLNYKKIVIKVGTKVLTSKDRALDRERVKDIVDQISTIQAKGIKTILVTSGAIGAGMGLLKLKRRPAKLSALQATASIGQNHLMRLYSEYFKSKGHLTGQMLLTQEDFNDRTRFLNIKNTITALLEHDAIPIINENDTVATDEIRCGDNDRLSGLVSDLCHADALIILTDVDGLLDESGRLISSVDEITARISKLGGRSRCDMGTGGMATKIEAAKYVTNAGIECVIANGRKKESILKILEGEAVGTIFKSRKVKFIAKKRWIAFSSRPKGMIKIDEGAKDALLRNKSLLASGIVAVDGNFIAGDVISIDVISIIDKDGVEFARGLANYSFKEVSRIMGHSSSAFKNILGYKGPDEVIHKDNLVIL
ncbi:MAG: glutamate 5-kinase [Candidatus Omnitrophica bacterium]|nr:glutamate 5-kinase [Candidatus Omnitrophota bacterium]